MKRPQNGGKAWINGEVNADSLDLIIPLFPDLACRVDRARCRFVSSIFPPEFPFLESLQSGKSHQCPVQSVGPGVQRMFRWRLQRAEGDGLPHLVPAKSRWRNVTVCQYPILSSDSPTSPAWAPRPRGYRCWGHPSQFWKQTKQRVSIKNFIL